MTPTRTDGSSSSATVDSAVQAPGAYMLTLCRLPTPVSIRPPQAPQLKKFKFFTSSSRHSDGDERHYLHMGYFATLDEAQKCAQLIRRKYPQAVATRAPAALDSSGSNSSFALQLNWSVQPIDPNTVSLPSIVRAYTLYLNESQRDGRSWYSLRLGFFNDAISAKQVASYVRSSFSSVAVVPITEEERINSSDTRIDTTAVTDTFGQLFDQALHADPARESGAPVTSSTPSPATQNPSRTETLEQTLELLASSELWDDGDSPSDTGVRHLSVQVQKRSSGR